MTFTSQNARRDRSPELRLANSLLARKSAYSFLDGFRCLLPEGGCGMDLRWKLYL